MQRLKISQDIKPLSEVRTGIANFIKQVHDTKRPVIITQHGKSVAVLLDANKKTTGSEYQEKVNIKTQLLFRQNYPSTGESVKKTSFSNSTIANYHL
jgi:prevent-host-death family protein